MNSSGQSRNHRAAPRSAAELLLIAVIAVLPSFLVGGTTLWACGVIFVLLGLLLLVKPPVRSLGLPLNILVCVFIVLALTSFAPAGWFGLPEWRRQAIQDFSIPLPFTHAPQPWLALEATLMMLAGISWLYLVLDTQSRSSYFLTGALKLFSAGLALLSAASIFLYWKNIPWPYQDAVAGFGPFPNKNQMAHVLAVGTLFSIACVYDEAMRHSSKGVVAWLLCAGISFAGLVLSNSRGGLGVFLIGLTAWLFVIVFFSRSRTKLAVGAATVSILLAAFVLFGGKLLERLQPPDQGGMVVSQDARWKIQKDALSLAMTSPVSGSGLGSFEPVFSLFHHALGKTLMGNVHPESDWLWLVDEMGWLALAVVLAGGFILVREALPLSAGREHWFFQAAGLAAGLMFFLHGFVDVAGHRLGSFMVAIFAFSFSVPKLPPAAGNRWIPGIFRAVGLLLVVAGSVWITATLKAMALPGTLASVMAQYRAVAAYTSHDFAGAIQISTSGLRSTPMEWRLYYDRAVGEALVDPPQVAAAKADFLRARFLQPVASELPYNEGLVWINEDAPDLVFQAWEEALRRVPDAYHTQQYSAMLGVAGQSPEFRAVLRKLAGNDHSLILAYLQAIKPENAIGEIDALRASDPELDTFTAPEKRAFLQLWAQYGDKGEVMKQIAARDKWLAVAWPVVVQDMASNGSYEQAYLVCHKYANLPAIPPSISTDASQVTTISAEYYSNPADFLAAFSMFEIYRKAGDWDKAAIVMERTTSQKNCPSYFFLLKAELLASRSQWKQALESLQGAQNSSAP